MSGANTVGKIVGTPSAPKIPAAEANPPVKAETAAEASTGAQIMDGVQLGLDVVGLIPGVGEIADLANAGISAARGDWIGASLSLASAIPFAGWGASAAKAGRRGAKMAAEAGAKATKEAADRAAKEAAEKAAKEAAEKAQKEAAEKAGKGKDGGKVKAREHKVPCFHPFDKKKFAKMTADEQKAYLKEMAEQLKRQQGSINSMTATEYKAARDAFENTKALNPTGSGRNPLADSAQASYRKDFASNISKSIRDSLINGGMGAAQAKTEAAARTKDVMGKLAALHEPDMVAGGWMHPDPQGMGRADVNSSIGSSWNQDGRVASMDSAAEDAIKNGRGNEKMNVKLEPCRGKGLK